LFRFKIISRQTEMTRKQRVGHGETSSYWTCCWQVVSMSTACVCAAGGHFKHML